MKDAAGFTPRKSASEAQQRARGAGDRARSPDHSRASGVTLEYPIVRHMNNLESVLTYEGTSEVHTLVLGQAVTGIAAFV